MFKTILAAFKSGLRDGFHNVKFNIHNIRG